MKKLMIKMLMMLCISFLACIPVQAAEEDTQSEETSEETVEETVEGTMEPVKGEGNTFEFAGRLIPLYAERLDLSGINLKDSNVEKLFDNMPNLKTVSLIDCGLSNDGYAKLQDKYPRIRMIWDIQFSRRKLHISGQSR